jgi:hypothetical protein
LSELSQAPVPQPQDRQLNARSQLAEKHAVLGRRIGILQFPGATRNVEYILCVLLLVGGLALIPVALVEIAGRSAISDELLLPRQAKVGVNLNPRNPNAHLFLGSVLLFGGILLLGLCVALTVSLRRNSSKPRVVVCEEGLLYEHGREANLIPWNEIAAFEVSYKGERPMYSLTLKHGKPIEISAGFGPDVTALMSFVERRLAQVNLLASLEAICLGRRMVFGAIQVDGEGLTVAGRFAPWSEISRVFTDYVTVIVEWSEKGNNVEIPHDAVSMPRLVFILARVLISDHARLPALDGHFRA